MKTTKLKKRISSMLRAAKKLSVEMSRTINSSPVSPFSKTLIEKMEVSSLLDLYSLRDQMEGYIITSDVGDEFVVKMGVETKTIEVKRSLSRYYVVSPGGLQFSSASIMIDHILQDLDPIKCNSPLTLVKVSR